MRKMRKFLFGIVVCIALNSFSQSTTGTRGLVKAPTARMFEDGTLSIGAAFIPPGYHKRTFGSKKGEIVPNAGLNTFVTVNLFPFMEVMFRYTHEANLVVRPYTGYFPDRMFTARFKVLNETEKRPAIVIGLQDVTAAFDASCKGCSNFSSTYAVASKQFYFKEIKIDASIGYGGGLGDLKVKEFDGFFGGVQISPPNFYDAQILVDYDATYLNIGVQKQLFNRIQTMVSYYPNHQKIGWVLAYRLNMF
jgi:hypothetical protein